jgi:hypothetical protein
MSDRVFLEVKATITAPHELQLGGWQAILNQFKNYCEQ